MRFILMMILLLQGWLFAAETDFDVAVVGTSPASMLEAIYHLHLNERVLILEADERCGGAWKSIDVCGILHADLGCHQIGSDQRLKDFLEKCFGCTFVCLEHYPEEAVGSHLRCPKGYYFSGGCHELISKMESAIHARSNGVLLHRRLESIYVDQDREYIELSLGDVRYTVLKLIITPVSSFRVENALPMGRDVPEHPYHHLYMLVEDPDPVQFTYLNSIAPEMSRAMNLTPFLEMSETGQQLIAIQTLSPGKIGEPQKFLEAFKAKGLLAQNAKLLATDEYTYRQRYSNFHPLLQLGGPMIELLDTSSFSGMNRYVEKWKAVIAP